MTHDMMNVRTLGKTPDADLRRQISGHRGLLWREEPALAPQRNDYLHRDWKTRADKVNLLLLMGHEAGPPCIKFF
ncbi:hypothetical protein [Mesorhizobium sp. M0146]|uniref:hypothetical protein n=1 Tax=unclassified Mesorhizobium TaxID=325217 RepID=UPI00333BB6D1